MKSARLAAVALMLGLAGCVHSSPGVTPTSMPTAASEWPATYARALTEARESRLGIADRVLTEFAQRFPESLEAAEVPYWRAVYKLDPSNLPASREALTLLDSYLASAPSGLHRIEAATLRRLAMALEARAAAIAAQTLSPVVRPEDKAQQEELARLRDELAKANAELSRIKRRVARPKP